MELLEKAVKMATLDLIEAGYSQEAIMNIFNTEEFEQRANEYSELFKSLAPNA